MIRFLVIAFLILLVLRWILKPLIKIAVVTTVKKMAAEQNRRYEAYNGDTKPEGSINVDYIPPKQNPGKSGKNNGDFVDYEEIK